MAYYALLKLHIVPSNLLELSEADKIFMLAAIRVKMEREEKQRQKLDKRRRVVGRLKG